MYGSNTIENDKMLFKCHTEVYNSKYGTYNDILKKELGPEWSIHFVKCPTNDLIKKSRESIGLLSDYVSIETDCGKKTKSETDGGVVYIQNGEKTICVLWVEGKSSFSVSKGARGQASGLISEQKERISSWNESIDNKVHALLGFCYGTDFNPIFGHYNIDRIQMDLHTPGNCNPYEENRYNSAWFYYKEKFTKDEAKSIISMALEENFKKLISILKTRKDSSII